jgi:hypothetical protein
VEITIRLISVKQDAHSKSDIINILTPLNPIKQLKDTHFSPLNERAISVTSNAANYATEFGVSIEY